MPEFSGLVCKRPIGGGSKSARDAVCLLTNDGQYVLRRQGGNAFADAELEGLIGKHIRGVGFTRDYTLILTSWEILDDHSK